jgi:hypothetical protein
MQKIMKRGAILILTMSLCFVLFSLAQAQCLTPGQAGHYFPNAIRAVSKPIWYITQNGTTISVSWVNHAPNPRFAIYDPLGDNTEDPSTWVDDLVLDKETGLVWERTPNGGTGWLNAIDLCYNKSAGWRKGWRLPTIEELASLIDPQQTIPPTLPNGHPFNNVQPTYYWSATTYESDNSKAWLVNMNNGNVEPLFKSTSNPVLCVRGGQEHDGW